MKTRRSAKPAQPNEGPWRVKVFPETMNARVYGKGRNLVAEVWSGRRPSLAVVKANARLIAASLTLRTACEQAEHWLAEELANPGEATPDMILRVLREAIAAAQPK